MPIKTRTGTDEAIQDLAGGVQTAGLAIWESGASLDAIADVFDREPSHEVADMAALVCINTISLHERLASAGADISSPPQRRAGISQDYVDELTEAWGRLRETDYRPVFDQPSRVLTALARCDAVAFVARCDEAANRLTQFIASSGQDIAGQIFNKLVADRKFLSAYYTSLPSARMLAGLSLSADRWDGVDWCDMNAIRKFAVVDPACGAGALLLATHQQIVRNHIDRSAKPCLDTLHKVLVEDTIHGADVVEAAINASAAALTAIAPDARFQRMNLEVFPLGNAQGRVGSLEWLDDRPGLPGLVPSTGLPMRPDADLVIANPPFRRHNSDTGNGDNKTRVFGHLEKDSKATSERLSHILNGTPANMVAGLGSAFVLLGHRMVRPGGRLAFILPSTSIFGASWSDIRAMLSSRYDIEWVVTMHSSETQSFSYDTHIAECMIIARKLRGNERASGRGRFVNLWRLPESVSEAESVLDALHRLPIRLNGLDDRPEGGTILYVGAEAVGEAIDAQVDEGPWTGGRWRSHIIAQYAHALTKGQLWSDDARAIIGTLPMSDLSAVAALSPHHLQIVGDRGLFDVNDGWDASCRQPAMWHVESDVQRKMGNPPNAHLVPKPDSEPDAACLWQQSGYLHIARNVRYNAQRIIATVSDVPALGVSSWFTLQIDVSADRRLAAEESLRRLVQLHSGHRHPCQQLEQVATGTGC